MNTYTRTILWFLAIILIPLGVVLIMPEDRIEPKEPIYEHYYPQVTYMLANDSIMDIHRFWGIDTITYYDWEESANALDIPAELMTIEIYMEHLQQTASALYDRNRY